MGIETLDTNPGPMNAWEKLVLGWLNYDVIPYQKTQDVHLTALTSNARATQAAILLLPDKEVITPIAQPIPSGSYVYYSGSGNDLTNRMSISINIPAARRLKGRPQKGTSTSSSSSILLAQVWFDIEEDWDYAYVQINGVNIETSLSRSTDPNGMNLGHGITGKTSGWQTLTADLSAFAGLSVELAFVYMTDTFVVETGLFVDDISVGTMLLGDAETEGSPGWTMTGFYRLNGSM